MLNISFKCLDRFSERRFMGRFLQHFKISNLMTKIKRKRKKGLLKIFFPFSLISPKKNNHKEKRKKKNGRLAEPKDDKKWREAFEETDGKRKRDREGERESKGGVCFRLRLRLRKELRLGFAA